MDNPLSATLPGLALGTLVRARRGDGPISSVPVEHLAVGDWVYNESNTAVLVTAVFEPHIDRMKDCRHLDFASNKRDVHFRCSSDHLLSLTSHAVDPLIFRPQGKARRVPMKWATRCAPHVVGTSLDSTEQAPSADWDDDNISYFQTVRSGITACEKEECNGFRLMQRLFDDQAQAEVARNVLLSSDYALLDPNRVLNGHIFTMTVEQFQNTICLAGKQVHSKLQVYRQRLKTPVDVVRSVEPLPLDAWLLGYWLGHGTDRTTIVTSADKEVGDHLQILVDRINTEGGVRHSLIKRLQRRKETQSPYEDQTATEDAYAYSVACESEGEGLNKVKEGLRSLGIFESRANGIPQQIMTASDPDKLKCLAGVIDSAGSNLYNGYKFTQGGSHYKLVHDVKLLAESLDMAVSPIARFVSKSKSRAETYTIKLTVNVERLEPYIQVARKRPPTMRRYRTDLSRPLTVTEADDGLVRPIQVEGRLFQLANGLIAHC